MAVVRDFIATVNRLTQAGPPAAVAEPATASSYERAGIEPSLEDLLQDPVVQLVMRADGIESGDIRRLLHAARQRSPASAGTASAASAGAP